MGHTNSTPNLQLPQFIGSDKPTWLSDVNGAMLAIDIAYGTIEADASSAVTAAAGAVTVAGAAQTAADNAASAAATAGTNASQALSTANNAASVALQAQTDAAEALAAVDGVLLGEVTADGVKSYLQIYTELYAAIDFSKLTRNSVLTIDNEIRRISYLGTAIANFTRAYVQSSSMVVVETHLESTNSTDRTFYINTTPAASDTDNTSEVPTSGKVFRIYA